MKPAIRSDAIGWPRINLGGTWRRAQRQPNSNLTGALAYGIRNTP
jgi:hypothetical protein